MSAGVSQFSFAFAMILAVGSLIFYLSSAIWSRLMSEPAQDNASIDFNLGLPDTKNRENLFAITLVTAGTSLSTVLVFFLTAGVVYGWWMILSPLAFAIGNWIMFAVFKKTHRNGYFSESSPQQGGAGLVPYLGERLTESKTVGCLLLLLSIFNLMAVLVLELVVGVEVFGYLTGGMIGKNVSSPMEFSIFAISICFLLGYVFVGGFRSVVTSDIWQYKAMYWSIIMTLISLAVFWLGKTKFSPNMSALSSSPPWKMLWGFIVNVLLGNFFVPLSQETSWQRFRAFQGGKATNFSKALFLSITKSVFLWLLLIILSFALLATVTSVQIPTLSSMSGVLEAFRTLNDWWFPLFVFPILTIAALSAMYSTADTCVSALLYLIEYRRISTPKKTAIKKMNKLSVSYYFVMAVILAISLLAYAFVRLWFNPSILQLVFSVFSNLVVVAPTVLSTAILKPRNGNTHNSRTSYVLMSLIFGSVGYWVPSLIAMILGKDYLWLSQLSIAIGLLCALLPMIPLWTNNSLRKEDAQNV